MRNNLVVLQSAFLTVVLIVCGVGIVGAIFSLIFSRKTWEEFGRHQMLMERDGSGPAATTSVSTAERDEEVRQMLEARNARRRRRGEPEIDVDGELARLTAPATPIDADLRSEIRDLVIARNHRRARQGKPPLDVESEIERQISELSSL